MNVGGLMYDILAIQNKWVNKLVWLRRRVIVRAVQRTLLSLFPFALLGSIARVVSISFLSDKGFYQQYSRDAQMVSGFSFSKAIIQ